MSKITPGEWVVVGPDNAPNPNMGLWEVHGSNAGHVASNLTLADAQLVSMVKDFYASAQSLLEAWDARTTGAQQIITGKSDRDLQKQAADAMEGLRAAIAKASN